MKDYRYNTYTLRLNDALVSYLNKESERMSISVPNVIRFILSERANAAPEETVSKEHV